MHDDLGAFVRYTDCRQRTVVSPRLRAGPNPGACISLCQKHLPKIMHALPYKHLICIHPHRLLRASLHYRPSTGDTDNRVRSPYRLDRHLLHTHIPHFVSQRSSAGWQNSGRFPRARHFFSGTGCHCLNATRRCVRPAHGTDGNHLR